MVGTARVVKLDAFRRQRDTGTGSLTASVGVMDLAASEQAFRSDAVADFKLSARHLEEPSAAYSAPGREVAYDDLYPADAPSTLLLTRARELLARNETRMTEALRMQRAGDALGADNEISLVQADLTELFCCRALSDGLSATTVALFHSLANRAGAPLESEQYLVVARVVRALSDNVFMSLDTALDLIDGLATANLATGPAELDHLVDLFAE